jgi:hypothetical protein
MEVVDQLRQWIIEKSFTTLIIVPVLAKPGVYQRTRLDDGDVEALAGIAVAKPEMGHQSSAYGVAIGGPTIAPHSQPAPRTFRSESATGRWKFRHNAAERAQRDGVWLIGNGNRGSRWQRKS